MSLLLRFLAANEWAMHSQTLDQMIAILERHAAGERMDQEAITAAIGRDPAAADSREAAMEIRGDTAIIPARGVIARYADQVNGICQARGRSAESLQSDLLSAADQGVNRIVLRMDSPGGQVSGTAETANLVRELSARGIEIIGYVDGLCASAMYWIASQCDEIVASSEAANVGSIGVATAIIERIPNEKAEKVHVITSAPAKSSPVLNEAQLANARSLVDSLAGVFASYVGSGRGLTEEQLAQVATGEVWTAKQALALGLVDRVGSLDSILSKPTQKATGPSRAFLPLTIATSAVVEPSPVLINNSAAEPAAASGDPMKITAQVLAALVVAHATHATFIAERANAGDDESTIRNAIAKKEQEQTQATIADLGKQLETERTKNAATAKQLADLQKEHADLKALAEAGSQNEVGGGSPDDANTKTQAEVAAMPAGDRAVWLSQGGKVSKA
jgi:ClpP class serine protease